MSSFESKRRGFSVPARSYSDFNSEIHLSIGTGNEFGKTVFILLWENKLRKQQRNWASAHVR